MLLKTLTEGTLFFPPRTTTHFIESYRVWGRGPHGVYVQERIRTRSKVGRGHAWGPAVEWSGEVLVEVVPEPQREGS